MYIRFFRSFIGLAINLGKYLYRVVWVSNSCLGFRDVFISIFIP